MTDHEARAREIVCVPGFCGCADDLAAGMSEEEASGHTDDCQRLQFAISQALREAEEAERERAASIVNHREFVSRNIAIDEDITDDDRRFHNRVGDILMDIAASIRGEKDNG